MAKSIDSVTLTAPATDPAIDTGQTFQMSATHTQAGHGGDETVSVYFEYSTTSGGPYTVIPTSGVLSTPTNPVSAADSTVTASATITANTANTYYVHVRAVGDLSAGSFENGNQIVTVSQGNSPTTVTLTGQSLTATGGTLTIARNFKKFISTTGQSLAVTEGTLTVTQSTPIDITLAGENVPLGGDVETPNYPANAVVKTLRASGGDYTSIQAWIDDMAATYPSGLVAANVSIVLECYDDWPSGYSLSTTLNTRAFSGLTSSTCYMMIVAPRSQRHTGVPQTGFYIDASVRVVNAGSSTELEAGFTRWEGIEFRQSVDSTFYGRYTSGSGNWRFENCIFVPTGSQSAWNNSSLQRCANLYVSNCLFISESSSSTAEAISLSNAGGTARIYNNTFVDYGTAIVETGTGAIVAYNNAGYNVTTLIGGEVSNDGSNVNSTNSADFANVAGKDYHLSSGSALRGVGNNLFADANYPITKDVDGGDRLSTGNFDIGFDKFGAAFVSGSTLSITREKNITLTGTNLAVSGGTTAISLDRHITLSSLAVPLSSGTLTITTTTNITVDLTGHPVGVSGGSLSIERNFRKDISTAGESVAVTGGTLVVTAEQNTVVNLAGESVAITGGTLTVTALVDTNVNLTPDALVITESTLSISRAVNIAIDLVADTLTVTEGTLAVQADVDTNVTLSADALVVTEGTLTISRATFVDVTLTAQVLTVSEGTLTIVRDKHVDLTADSLSVTEGTLTVSLDKAVNLIGQNLSVSSGTLTIESGISNIITLAGATITLSEGSIRYTTTRRSRIDNGHTPLVIPARSFDKLYANGSDWFTY